MSECEGPTTRRCQATIYTTEFPTIGSGFFKTKHRCKFVFPHGYNCECPCGYKFDLWQRKP